MRVSGGALRGRRIAVPRGDAARPTSDRVREALFSSLGELAGARVIDLFAGSGALAIEALSRGAESALLVEKNPRHAAVIAANLEQLGLLARAQLLVLPLERAHSAMLARGPFELLFADPPYRQLADASRPIERLLLESLTDDARLVIEHSHLSPPPQWPAAELVRSRRYGDTMLSFYLRALAAPA